MYISVESPGSENQQDVFISEMRQLRANGECRCQDKPLYYPGSSQIDRKPRRHYSYSYS